MKILVLSVLNGILLFSGAAHAREHYKASNSQSISLNDSVRLKNCQGRMSLAPEQRLRVSYEGINNCSNLQIISLGIKEKLSGENGSRSGTFDYNFTDLENATITFSSNSGAHQDSLDVRSSTNGRQIDLRTCGGRVKIAPIAHVNIKVNHVNRCSYLEVKGNPYEFNKSGEVSVALKDLLASPSIKVSDRKSSRSVSDHFTFVNSSKRLEKEARANSGSSNCSDKAFEAAADKFQGSERLGFSGALWMNLFSKVEFDRESNKGNYVYKVTLPFSKGSNNAVSYYARSRYEVVADPRTCKILQVAVDE